jgi:hypothetical protein
MQEWRVIACVYPRPRRQPCTDACAFVGTQNGEPESAVDLLYCFTDFTPS